MNQEDTRSVRTTIDIDAPREKVWKALTDPEELMRWFPLQARVTPGEGGSIFLGWGGEFDTDCRIRSWEDGRRLQMTWFEPVYADAGANARELLVDFDLAGEGGKTTLRLVHSGFGSGNDWDHEFDSVSRGWNFELRSLRHYLEHHAGTDRRVVWTRHAVPGDSVAVWDRLWSADGLLAGGQMPGSSEGDRYAVSTADGDSFEGRVLVNARPKDFVATASNLGGALFRVGYELCSGRPEISLWLSSWGESGIDLDALQQRWQQRLSKLYA